MYGLYSWGKSHSKFTFLKVLVSLLTVNLFVPNAPFPYPQKKSENLEVFCFQGLEKMCIRNKWINRKFILKVPVSYISADYCRKLISYCTAFSHTLQSGIEITEKFDKRGKYSKKDNFFIITVKKRIVPKEAFETIIYAFAWIYFVDSKILLVHLL